MYAAHYRCSIAPVTSYAVLDARALTRLWPVRVSRRLGHPSSSTHHTRKGQAHCNPYTSRSCVSTSSRAVLHPLPPGACQQCDHDTTPEYCMPPPAAHPQCYIHSSMDQPAMQIKAHTGTSLRQCMQYVPQFQLRSLHRANNHHYHPTTHPGPRPPPTRPCRSAWPGSGPPRRRLRALRAAAHVGRAQRRGCGSGPAASRAQTRAWGAVRVEHKGTV